MTTQNRSRRIIGRVIMILGILCIVIGVGYELLSYPWKTVFGGLPDVAKMKEPNPIPIGYYSYEQQPASKQELKVLPAQNGNLPLTRPVMDLAFMGTVKIPRLNLSENIVQGVGDEILYAVGHDPASAEPGEIGNVVLAGHRNYVFMHPFKYLPNMEVGDNIYIETYNGKFVYEVYQTLTVSPDEVWVTEPQPEQERMLTLITCTPIPSYSERLVVQAKLVESEQV